MFLTFSYSTPSLFISSRLHLVTLDSKWYRNNGKTIVPYVEKHAGLVKKHVFLLKIMFQGCWTIKTIVLGPFAANQRLASQRTKNDVRKDKKVKFALEDRRNVAAAVVAVPRQGYSSNKCCGGEEEPNTQHKCCGNKSCNNHVDPLAPSLSHVSLRKFFAPATLQQPCARLCVSRPARAMPKPLPPSPPERPNWWEPGSSQQPPPPWPAADDASFPPLVPSANARNPRTESACKTHTHGAI